MKLDSTPAQSEFLKIPAFTPQIVQDSLGRIVAPMPGLNRLEHFTLALMPYYLGITSTRKGAIEKSIEAAADLLKELQATIEATNENQITLKPM